MNKSNKLLVMLDRVFGFDDKEKSKFRKISQDFDERTNEHVIMIEYRVRVAGTMKSFRRKKGLGKTPHQSRMRLLKQMVADLK